jgi:hypothetical protein
MFRNRDAAMVLILNTIYLPLALCAQFHIYIQKKPIDVELCAQCEGKIVGNLTPEKKDNRCIRVQV